MAKIISINTNKRNTDEMTTEELRKAARGDVYLFAAAGAGACAIPGFGAFSDSIKLSAIELALVNKITKLYGLSDSEDSRLFVNTIIEAGAVSWVAKNAASALKLVPGIRLAASTLNAVVAAAFVTAIGEGTIYLCDQIKSGKKQSSDIEWIKKEIESRFTPEFVEQLMNAVNKLKGNWNKNNIAKVVLEVFMNMNVKPNTEKSYSDEDYYTDVTENECVG